MILCVITGQEAISDGVSVGISAAGICVMRGVSGALETAPGSPIRVTQASDETRIVKIAKSNFTRGMIYPYIFGQGYHIRLMDH
jgi:hypothetical protein